jgi:TolB-like protein
MQINSEKCSEVSEFQADEVWSACDLILGSDLFCQSPRLSRLLRFLVEKAISGDVHETSEHAIGIAVFNRDPVKYYTCEDPIVRVQVGRLRHKLKTYYARGGSEVSLRICIPVGCYMPTFERHDAMKVLDRTLTQLAVLPFKCISIHGGGTAFVQGLHEELMHRLYKTFGNVVVTRSESIPFEDSVSGVSQRLEGSIQMDMEAVKAFIRLVDEPSCHVVMSEQFSLLGPLGLRLQENLASLICDSLRNSMGTLVI